MSPRLLSFLKVRSNFLVEDKLVSNEAIRGNRVILIDETGLNVGEIDIWTAKSRASSAGFDLVQMGFDSKTHVPICKIMDLGKYKYEQSKKKQPKNHANQLKEVSFKLQTSDHDIDIKKRKVLEMLEKKYKVKFGIELRGREKAHQQNAKQIVKQHADSFLKVAKYDNVMTTDRSIFVMLNPL